MTPEAWGYVLIGSGLLFIFVIGGLWADRKDARDARRRNRR